MWRPTCQYGPVKISNINDIQVQGAQLYFCLEQIIIVCETRHACMINFLTTQGFCKNQLNIILQPDALQGAALYDRTG